MFMKIHSAIPVCFKQLFTLFFLSFSTALIANELSQNVKNTLELQPDILKAVVIKNVTIVDTLHDAISCFLTTDLDLLIVGPYLISKKDALKDNCLTLSMSKPEHVDLVKAENTGENMEQCQYAIMCGKETTEISEFIHRTLTENQALSLSELIQHSNFAINKDDICDEIMMLWSRRLIWLTPTTYCSPI